jgi:hypothetical protein
MASKYTKWPQNKPNGRKIDQMTIDIPNGRKIYQMAVKYSKWP